MRVLVVLLALSALMLAGCGGGGGGGGGYVEPSQHDALARDADRPLQTTACAPPAIMDAPGAPVPSTC